MNKLREAVALSAWQARLKTTDGWDVFCRLDAFEEHMAVADAAIKAMFDHLDNVSEGQINAARSVMRAFVPPNNDTLAKAFRAMIQQARKEWEDGK